MRRVSVLVSLLAVALVAWVALGRGGATVAQDGTPSVGGAQGRGSSAAQDGTPAAGAGHPLVGTWFVDAFPDDPTNPPDLSVYTADGGVIDISGGQAAGGAWEATGPRTAAVTFVFVDDTEDFAGTFTIRATVEVDAAGETFAGPYSFTVVAADGTVLDSGEGTARATRLAVEPVEAAGTPVAAVPTWMPDADEGTPAP